ncbi:hypothetical protein [Halomonas getboli]|uniref:hypothetical protein n=1 Tax=Halomonas getboli TaxID=2935862 RepID=UPI001FFFB2D8|nr:hypothetical protein [Halomonas getboli]MCK2183548.1 hypothetical protein [Halomonas getboli]
MTPFVIAIGVVLAGICLAFGGLLTYIGVVMGYQSADWRRLSPGGRFGLAVAALHDWLQRGAIQPTTTAGELPAYRRA